MKTITVWQPWAGALAAGIKENETRSWATKYRGPIAIHAAMRDIFDGLELIPVPTALKIKEALRCEWADMPRGAIVATGELVDCIRITPEFVATLSRTNWHSATTRWAGMRGNWRTSRGCRSRYPQRESKGSGTGRRCCCGIKAATAGIVRFMWTKPGSSGKTLIRELTAGQNCAALYIMPSTASRTLPWST